MFDIKSLPEIIQELDAEDARADAKKTLGKLRKVLVTKLKDSDKREIQVMVTALQSPLGCLMLCTMFKCVDAGPNPTLQKFIKALNDPKLEMDLMTDACLQTSMH